MSTTKNVNIYFVDFLAAVQLLMRNLVLSFSSFVIEQKQKTFTYIKMYRKKVKTN